MPYNERLRPFVCLLCCFSLSVKVGGDEKREIILVIRYKRDITSDVSVNLYADLNSAVETKGK